MTMAIDDCTLECHISDSDEDDVAGEQINIPPPPPEFASKATTPVLSAHADAPRATQAAPPHAQTVNRDPYGINQHLKVVVSDILPRAEAPHSIEQVSLYSSVGFEKTRVWTYRFLSLLLAVPFAFLCGTFLAILAYLHVWFVIPCIQLSHTFLPCLRSLIFCAVNSFIAPFCMSFALCCSQIAIFVSNRHWHQMRDKNIV
ncbi:caveolin-2 [Festucalex cinctus]